ncbi:mediator of RNA polymerase II transcription subunit 10 isoform X2 [Prinia subflava]|uniref:mediator of RNA polymerase II transcription subunit 10 isoform X2 n=1 Tax=Prinia subflava TaxID=208062 RepID=UPI002FE1D232
MAEKFDSLEEHLEKFVENIRQLGIIVSDFQPSSQTGLNQKLNFMVTGLQDIDKCRQQLHDISVPLEVFEYIDQGRNPQLYTKECLERALAKNEQVKGKIDTMKVQHSASLWVRDHQTCSATVLQMEKEPPSMCQKSGCGRLPVPYVFVGFFVQQLGSSCGSQEPLGA